MSPDFVVGNLKHSCVGSEQTKEVFLGGGEGAFWLAQRLQ